MCEHHLFCFSSRINKKKYKQGEHLNRIFPWRVPRSTTISHAHTLRSHVNCRRFQDGMTVSAWVKFNRKIGPSCMRMWVIRARLWWSEFITKKIQKMPGLHELDLEFLEHVETFRACSIQQSRASLIRAFSWPLCFIQGDIVRRN